MSYGLWTIVEISRELLIPQKYKLSIKGGYAFQPLSLLSEYELFTIKGHFSSKLGAPRDALMFPHSNLKPTK